MVEIYFMHIKKNSRKILNSILDRIQIIMMEEETHSLNQYTEYNARVMFLVKHCNLLSLFLFLFSLDEI